jgi:hypothetical protein
MKRGGPLQTQARPAFGDYAFPVEAKKRWANAVFACFV